MDGLQATRRLKQDARTADVPVVMVTAYDAGPYRRAAEDAGCAAILTRLLDGRLTFRRAEGPRRGWMMTGTGTLAGLLNRTFPEDGVPSGIRQMWQLSRSGGFLTCERRRRYPRNSEILGCRHDH